MLDALATGEFKFEPNGMRAHSNGLAPALAACAHCFGVACDDIRTIVTECQEFKDDRYRRSVSDAGATISVLATRVAGRNGPA